MKISVYIPYYNASTTVNDVVEAVKNQSLRASEILIVDDGSDIKAKDILKSDNITIIEHNRNLGLAQARNTALKNLDNNLVAALDADCVPERDWLKKLYSALNNGSSLGIAGSGGKLMEKYRRTPADKWRCMFMKQNWGKDKSFPTYLCGNNTLYKKKFLEEAGLYNDFCRTNYEDVDIALKLKKKGFGFVYEPGAVVKHYKKDTVSSVLSSYWNWQFPPKYNLGRYDHFEGLKDQINLNMSYTFLALNQIICKKKKDMIPIGFLLFFSHTLMDVKKFLSLKKQTLKPDYNELREGLLEIIYKGINPVKNGRIEIEKNLRHTAWEGNASFNSRLKGKELVDFIFERAKHFVKSSRSAIKTVGYYK